MYIDLMSARATSRLAEILRQVGVTPAEVFNALLMRTIDGTDPLTLRKLFPDKLGPPVTFDTSRRWPEAPSAKCLARKKKHGLTRGCVLNPKSLHFSWIPSTN
jgi:hypothetical protein